MSEEWDTYDIDIGEQVLREIEQAQCNPGVAALAREPPSATASVVDALHTAPAASPPGSALVDAEHDASLDSTPQGSPIDVAVTALDAEIISDPSNIAEKDIRRVLAALLANRELTTETVKSIRGEVEKELNAPAGSLDYRKEEVCRITQDVVSIVCIRRSNPHTHEESFGEEKKVCAKEAYLATFPHPQEEDACNGPRLRAPGEFSREEIRDVILEAIKKTNAQKYAPLVLLKMVIFREHHAGGEVHYHVALVADRAFRFGPLKKYIRSVAQLASHWSTSHEMYYSCVAYGFWPTPHKSEDELDPTPLLWAKDGTHPPLSEASRRSWNAAGLEQRKLHIAKKLSEKGKKEEKFKDLDLWPVVVNEGIAANARATKKVIAYAARCGGHAMLEWAFQNECRIADLVARCWRFEKATDIVERDGKTRLELLWEARSRSCTCNGRWTSAALDLFWRNGLDVSEWCAAVIASMEKGHSKVSLVCHVGDEGKSFLLDPLKAVFGEEEVFTPVKSGFPLMGLESCRLALLDDWRFGEDILSYNVQLLWFEGKPVIIARPQNQCSGHLRYKGDDPIFISTLETNLLRVHKGLEHGDVAMMLKRLKIFRFSAKLENVDRTIPSCPKCFADLLFVKGYASGPIPAGGSGEPVRSPKRAAPGDYEERTDAALDNKKRKTWSVVMVASWLDALCLGHLSERFRENGVDGEFLSELSQEDLVGELGLSKLQAKKIIAKWNHQVPAS